MTSKQQQPPYYYLPFILFALAILFLASLIFTIQEDVFFSGDGGLKFLMVKQIAKGGSYTTLNLEAPRWVSNIWSQGFYPFKEPFVYELHHVKTVSFPPAFQWINACIYSVFGFKGIYLIPCLSISALWLWFIVTMQRLGAPPLRVSVAFFLLAFCSPLTVYGALYWEHGPAIVLCLSAIVYLVRQPSSILKALMLGLLAGCSVWLRPEMLVLCLLIILAMLFNGRSQKSKATIVFILSLLTNIVAFFVFNFEVYGNILGAHSFQLLESPGIKNYVAEKFIILFHLNGRLVLYFPLIVLYYFVVFYALLRKEQFNKSVKYLTLVSTLFLLLVPFVLPNGGGKQWGPRYLLPVIPIVIMSFCLLLRHYETLNIPRWIRFVLLPVCVYSVYLNVYLAHHTLQNDATYRIKPALTFLKNQACDVLVVQNQYIAQEYASLFETKKIFLAEDQQSFDALEKLLKVETITKLIYISHDAEFKRSQGNLLNGTAELEKIGDYYLAAYELK